MYHPFADAISPLGNKLAHAYALPAQLDLPEETKEAEQVESSRESNEFVRQGEDALKARDYRSAVRAWRHAVVDDPKNGTTIMMLAEALFAAGYYDEAAAAAQQAMMLLRRRNGAKRSANSEGSTRILRITLIN